MSTLSPAIMWKLLNWASPMNHISSHTKYSNYNTVWVIVKEVLSTSDTYFKENKLFNRNIPLSLPLSNLQG